MYKTSLFIFRRDLRLEDNKGLIQALSSSQLVIPAFIFTPEQTERNPYKSERCFQLMLHALNDLDEMLKSNGSMLYCFYGKSHEVVEQCIKKLKIEAVFVNQDYTPYSVKRDELINKNCIKYEIPFITVHDALLHPPEDTVKKGGEPYLIFTPFYKNASRFPVEKPIKNRRKNYFSEKISFAIRRDNIAPFRSPRKEALKILSNLYPASNHLSPYLKFTICSIREAYWALYDKFGKDCEAIKELYWRDFFTSIAFFFPHVFKGAFHEKYNRLEWKDDKASFHLWCKGMTGFPLVDASMRQLRQTGEIPNRMRMVVASFLIKDLHINWQWGEKYFAQTLLDYDPAVNNGNWQWVAGTGTDAQPYFRVFNPWSQQKKFDPDCFYIKTWIPELSDFPPKIIHSWYDRFEPTSLYPVPILDHNIEMKHAIDLFKKAL